MSVEETLRQPQFPYSVKIEQTQKGARVTVHVNSNDVGEVKNQAVELYVQTKADLANRGQVVAPEDSK